MAFPTRYIPTRKVFYDNGSGDGGGTGGDTGGAGGAGGGGDAGAGDGPWYQQHLTDDALKADPNITKYGSLDDFARGHINQAKLLGKPADRLFELPGAEDREGRIAVLRKLGAPEQIDGYKLTAPEGIDETLTPEGGLAKMFLQAAHKHAILPEQAQAIYQDVVSGLHQAIQEDETSGAAEVQKGRDALKTEWGPAYDQNLAAARFGAEKVAEKAGVSKEEASAAFDNHFEVDPVMLKMFSAVGKMLGEDSAGSDGTGFNQVMAPKEAEAKAQDLLRQAMQQKDMNERRRLNQEAAKYYQMAYPDKAAS